MQGSILATARGLKVGDDLIPTNTSSMPLFEIQTGPTDSLNILELSGTFLCNGGGSVAYVIGVGVPAAAGVGIGPYTIGYDDAGATGNVPAAKLYTDWTTQPTVPTNFLRRMTANTQNVSTGAGSCPWLFRFPRGYRMAASSSLVLWAIAPAANYSGGFTYCSIPSIVVDG